MYRLNIKKYVDVMFDGNINKFAKAIGVNYNPAKQLYSSETTRINFDVLTSLCNTFHCTPNDILINDDITKWCDSPDIVFDIDHPKEKSQESTFTVSLNNPNDPSTPIKVNVDTKDEEKMAQIAQDVANQIVHSFMRRHVVISADKYDKLIEQIKELSDAKK